MSIRLHWYLPTHGDGHTFVLAGDAQQTELGIDEFILSGYPHVEEAYAFREGVLPVLRERGLVRRAGARLSARPPRCPARSNARP